ncbi:winged helix-turn-helix transcriptional regulator [Lysobacter auxotrophicus]|uniref:Helix-turn-helix transcriptional regulator n=1 Tax=Lysobacter auxotrophicus TaxID=2992573 RepID=A0ABM8DHL5_9GAMM|nr:helix-turn-helix domain-containing protein [Lysobacter auxotrophicus]BDU18127.1 helix-turn-helix transcriptional regulator [Lysobacter auxotrophicus]
MALFDLLGRRWAMGVLWTLAESGALTFRALQERCESISPAVLNQRLKELQMARLVARDVDGYVVTDMGQSVYERLAPLGQTAREWAELLDAN